MDQDKKDKKSKHKSRGDSKDRDKSKREKSHDGERRKSRKHHTKDKEGVPSSNDQLDGGLKLKKPRN